MDAVVFNAMKGLKFEVFLRSGRPSRQPDLQVSHYTCNKPSLNMCAAQGSNKGLLLCALQAGVCGLRHATPDAYVLLQGLRIIGALRVDHRQQHRVGPAASRCGTVSQGHPSLHTAHLLAGHLATAKQQCCSFARKQQPLTAAVLQWPGKQVNTVSR